MATSSVIASASPSASAAVVLAVGTRFIGHASSETRQSSATSAACASVDSQLPVMVISRAPSRLIVSSSRSSLVGLAAVRQRNDHVVGLDHAEIAVNRFGRVEEEGRRAGAGERGGDLPADDARLAHAGDDDAAAAVEQQPDGALEAVVEPIDEREDRGRLGLQDLARERDVRPRSARVIR